MEQTARAIWAHRSNLVQVRPDNKVVVRAVSPIVDAGLALRGVLVLSIPLDGDFAMRGS